MCAYYQRSSMSQPAGRSSARRDSDRSADYIPAGDRYHHDRHNRDRDDRDTGDRHATNRDRDMSTPRRAASEQVPPPPPPPPTPRAGPQDGGKELDRAASELARLQRQICDAVFEKVMLTNRHEVELKGLRRRESDYKRASGAQFPAVADSLARHQDLVKKHVSDYDQDLAKVNKRLDRGADEYGQLLVRAMPTGEIKTRQLVDMARAEMAKVQPPAPPDDRFQKLEQQLASLQEAQAAQATSLGDLKRENEEQAASLSQLKREREEQAASLSQLKREKEEQAARLSELKEECERLRSRDASYEAQAGELASLGIRHEQLRERDSGLQAQLDALGERVTSQETNLGRTLEEVRSRPTRHATPVDATLGEKLTDLERRVREHDNQISSFDINEYTEAVDKLLAYPAWANLDGRLQAQQSKVQRLDTCLQELSGASEKRFQDINKDLEDKFGKLTGQLIDLTRGFINDSKKEASELESRVRSLEQRNAAASRAPSAIGASSPQLAGGNGSAAELGGVPGRMRAAEAAISGLRNDLDAWRDGATRASKANESMILDLNTQFKNMTTPELAHIILEHLKRLPAMAVPLDLQNLHERLANLEAYQRDQTRRHRTLTNWTTAAAGTIQDTAGKRGPTDENLSDREEKRPRMEGLNGVPNGLAARQTSLG